MVRQRIQSVFMQQYCAVSFICEAMLFQDLLLLLLLLCIIYCRLFWFQKVFCSNEIVALVTLIFLIDLDYMQIYLLFILKEKFVCLITFSSHKHTNPPIIFTKNAEVP